MKMPLAGMYAALMTGLSDNGDFDPGRQRAIDAYVLAQGLTGLYVGGSSGESGLLTVDELLAQQAVAAESARGSGATLIAHVGFANLRDSIRLARNAEALGYHGLSALPPHAYPFSDDEIFGYYEALAAATELPMIVYEVPVRTGRPIPSETLGRILELRGVAGIKFTSTDLFKFSVLKARYPGSTFFFGFDEIYLAGGALGAHGGIGTTYNLLGRLYVALHRAIAAGDLAAAQRLQAVSRRFVEVLMQTGVLPGMKAALRLRGIDCGPTRLPMAPGVADCEARIQAALDDPALEEWLLPR
ncbi:dihydrodipicolinate synthase family protein [Nitratireductor sp. ZSWI3]|uniref:dihydrodipicolinate synthase family protein n=1 Tax=Nitratireductor sp. ZSWI3 TaxID=2966359 RepID=UPI00215025DB|nr:dihydrodipicolinate synthase family protein [Nitratireductor sp. ZSWI3]MCR4265133.1 dihydrodipicolinate synthase family protein [Nitratireductor sp. ZSWI3]